MAKNLKQFRDEYENMSTDERRHMKKLIALFLALVLIPVIFGICLAAGAFPLWNDEAQDWDKINQDLIEAAEHEPIYADVDWDLKDYIECTVPSGYVLKTDKITGEGEITSENNSENIVAFLGIDDYKGQYNISLTDCIKHMYHTIEGTGKNEQATWIYDKEAEEWLEKSNKIQNGDITIYMGEDNALLKKGGSVMHVELNGPEFETHFTEFCKSIKFK